MSIEAKIMIDAPDNFDVSTIISAIELAVSNINGNRTRVNVVEVDNPMTISPIQMLKRGEAEE